MQMSEQQQADSHQAQLKQNSIQMLTHSLTHSPHKATRNIERIHFNLSQCINPLTPNDLYISRTAPLTSKRCILYIYSTNVGTEYFKHALYSPFFFSSKCNLFHNANLFGSCIIHILYTECAEIKKKKINNSGAKGLKFNTINLIPRVMCRKQLKHPACEHVRF